MSTDQPTKNNIQLVWGAALIMMGVAVFFRIPQVMPKLVEMGQSAGTVGFIRVCFYVLGFILIGGGLKKVINHFKPDESSTGGDPGDKEDN